MSYVTLIVVALFIMKLLWNLTVPYVLAVRLWRTKTVDKVSTSFMTFIELTLLGIIAILSLFDNGSPLSWTIGTTLLVGGGLIAGSYVHFVVAGFLVSWIGSKLHKRAHR
jgi:hypothetical protein